MWPSLDIYPILSKSFTESYTWEMKHVAQSEFDLAGCITTLSKDLQNLCQQYQLSVKTGSLSLQWQRLISKPMMKNQFFLNQASPQPIFVKVRLAD